MGVQACSALFVFSALAATVLAQSGSGVQTRPQPDAAQAGATTFRADSNLVLIPISVTDDLNRFVLGLQKQDFRLLDDGVEQSIAHLSGEDVPLSVGLAFDTSGSMNYKLSTSQEAAKLFLKALNPEDEAFLVEFSDSAKVTAPFSKNPDEIRNAIDRAQPGGLTALLDGIKLSLTTMKNAKNARKAIVVISDGGDNHSTYTAKQIEALVREADVEVYAMGVFDPLASILLTPEEVSGPKLLSEISAQTGGRAFAASFAGDLPSVAARIAIELRNQYVIGYYPTNRAHDGKYHTVEVKIPQPAGMPSLKGHWRQGYYAPSDNN